MDILLYIINVFDISQFVYLFSSILVPSCVVKELKLYFIYVFLWKGKGKVRRSVIIQQVEKGGHKMVHVNSVISANQLTGSLRMKSGNNQTWFNIFNYSCYTQKYGDAFLINWNFDTDPLSVHLSPFHDSTVVNWSWLCSSVED